MSRFIFFGRDSFRIGFFRFFFPFMYVGGMPKPWFYWEFMESTVNQWVFGHKMYEWLIFEVHFHVRLRGWGLPILKVFFVPSSLKGYPFIIYKYIYIYTKYHHHCIDTGNFPFATSTTHFLEQNGWFQAMSSLALCEAAKKFFAASIFSQPPVALAWKTDGFS